MKRLLVLALLALAAWQAWKHGSEILHRQPAHQAVVRNESTRNIVRLRFGVGQQVFVKERLAANETAVFPFRVSRDASFSLVWEWEDAPSELTWRGGYVTSGPLLQRHVIGIHRGGGVTHSVERLEPEP